MVLKIQKCIWNCKASCVLLKSHVFIQISWFVRITWIVRISHKFCQKISVENAEKVSTFLDKWPRIN